MKHLSTRENGKYKTRNIYSLTLSLSLSLSLLQNIILLFCYLVQHIPLVRAGALTCHWIGQNYIWHREGVSFIPSLGLGIIDIIWVKKSYFQPERLTVNSLKKVHYSITATIRQTATIFYILKRCSALLLLPVCGVVWAVSCVRTN